MSFANIYLLYISKFSTLLLSQHTCYCMTDISIAPNWFDFFPRWSDSLSRSTLYTLLTCGWDIWTMLPCTLVLANKHYKCCMSIHWSLMIIYIMSAHLLLWQQQFWHSSPLSLIDVALLTSFCFFCNAWHVSSTGWLISVKDRTINPLKSVGTVTC